MERTVALAVVAILVVTTWPAVAWAYAQSSQIAAIHRLADEGIHALMEHYWMPGQSYLSRYQDDTSRRAGFWTVAQAWDAIMDAVERTGGVDSPFFPYMEDVYEGAIRRNPTLTNPYNDDMAWWSLAAIRAYGITGEERYLAKAIDLWNTILRSWDEAFGGGIWWRNDEKTGKNACINAPAAIIAAKLYRITGEAEYLDWSLKLYEWVKTNLAATGLVFDQIRADGTLDRRTFTYNQGTYIGAAVELYRITGDERYLEDARLTARLTMERLADAEGILPPEGPDAGAGFKGIFVRYLVSLMEVDAEPQQYLDFLVRNAVHAAEHAVNDQGLIGHDWYRPATGPVHMLGHASAMMLFNLVSRLLSAEEAVGVQILSPRWDEAVLADARIALEVAPWLEAAEFVVLENGVEVYRGPNPPADLTLAAPVKEEGERHTLSVVVTDAAGDVRERSVRFRVYRLDLGVPDLRGGPVHGRLVLAPRAGLRPHDGVSRLELAFLPASGPAAGERRVLFDGPALPGTVTIETLEYPDGPYDLVLVAFDGAGAVVAQATERVVILNWETLLEPFSPPVSLFGATFDSLKAVERSDGWTHVTDRAEEFFGDEARLAATGTGEQSLVWKYERLAGFTLTVYAKEEGAGAHVRAAASADGAHWQPVELRLERGRKGPAGWLSLELTSATELPGGTQYLRVSTLPEDAGGPALQLGELVLRRPVGN